MIVSLERKREKMKDSFARETERKSVRKREREDYGCLAPYDEFI